VVLLRILEMQAIFFLSDLVLGMFRWGVRNPPMARHRILSKSFDTKARILSAQSTFGASGAASVGRTTHGLVKIHGPLFGAKLLRSSVGLYRFDGDHCPAPEWVWPDTTLPECLDVFCLLIVRWEDYTYTSTKFGDAGLILTSSNDVANEYSRVGYWEQTGFDDDKDKKQRVSISDTDYQTITVI